MKLLLITTLYPAYKNQSKIEETYAVHYFAKEWAKNNNVSVIRLFPTYPKWFKFLNRVKKNNIISNYEDKYTIDGVGVKRVSIRKYPKVDFRKKDIENTAIDIIKCLDDEEIPDFIICDTLNPSIYIGEIVARKFNSKLIASLHNSDIFYTKNDKNYKKFIRVDPSIERIVFRSKNVEQKFMERYQGKKNKNDFSTILFGIEKKDIMSEEKFQNKLDRKMKEIIVACSLKKLKKVDVLIKAFSKLNNRNNYILRIIGDGPERNNLEKLSESLDCKSCVLFEGEKDHEKVLEYMEKADVFAMVSSPETFGLVYVEAMAKGCITIGSKGEGIDGVIHDKQNGFLCKPDSVENLKTILQEIMHLNKDEKIKILYSARSTVEDLTYEKLSSTFLSRIQQ